MILKITRLINSRMLCNVKISQRSIWNHRRNILRVIFSYTSWHFDAGEKKKLWKLVCYFLSSFDGISLYKFPVVIYFFMHTKLCELSRGKLNGNVEGSVEKDVISLRIHAALLITGNTVYCGNNGKNVFGKNATLFPTVKRG